MTHTWWVDANNEYVWHCAADVDNTYAPTTNPGSAWKCAKPLEPIWCSVQMIHAD